MTENGILLLNKPEGMTSQTAVTRVRRLLGAAKAGHTGTLDPLATGVLPVLLERGVKASEYLLTGDKQYRATLRLGLRSDTEDITGNLVPSGVPLPSEEQVREVAASFVGDYDQIPPMYSAIRVDGHRLMELARQGKEIERQPRRVRIFSLTVSRREGAPAGDYDLDVVCSKGTYIRTLCADIGERLGCGGVMAALCRTAAAGFTLAQCHTPEQLEAMTEEERRACILPIESIFLTCPAVTLSRFYARLAHCGATLLQRKLQVDYPAGTRVRLCDEGGFFALAEAVDTEEGIALRPCKLFSL